MISTKVTYQGKYRFESEYLSSGDKIHTDVSVQNGGQGIHPTPVHVLAAALATCAMTTMAMGAEKHGESFEGCYAEIGEIEEDETKVVVTRITITFHLKAAYSDAMRKRLESYARRACYVGNTLTAEKNFIYLYE
ncbi:MAG TPA: OsmC family protein [Prevotella sp.]